MSKDNNVRRNLKHVMNTLPLSWQDEAKRLYYSWQIRRRRFRTDEQEFRLLEGLVSPGDWTIDVGANIGHYTIRLARLVGREGRVIALEPVPRTFALLAANVQMAGVGNVTLINAAASELVGVANMHIPMQHGVANFYQAQIVEDIADCSVLTIPLDSFSWPHRVALVKIDVEGHEGRVLSGMVELLKRDRPTLVIETSSDMVESFLHEFSYESRRLHRSPNTVFRPIPLVDHRRCSTG
jgi:FkbM family methyltransferase